MQQLKNLITLRQYCEENDWPRLPQWQHWIYTKKPIAVRCIKKIGGRYLVDIKAWQEYVANATLDEEAM